ncbi:MAG: BrnT family toxin [Phycisphaerales bacterium]
MSDSRLQFEWDPSKAERNARKHGVHFAEALTVFQDRRHQLSYDHKHFAEEDRYKVIGISGFGRVLAVCIADEEGVVRIISARKATRHERNEYEGH